MNISEPGEPLMSETITEPPTSTAATKETKPEVVAAVFSGEGSPDLSTAFRVGTFEIKYGAMLLLCTAGIALGYGITRWWQRR
jgi:hypothetical protein